MVLRRMECPEVTASHFVTGRWSPGSTRDSGRAWMNDGGHSIALWIFGKFWAKLRGAAICQAVSHSLGAGPMTEPGAANEDRAASWRLSNAKQLATHAPSRHLSELAP